MNGKMDTKKNAWFQVAGGYIRIQEIHGLNATGLLYSGGCLQNFFNDFLCSKDIGIVRIDTKSVGVVQDLSKSDLYRKCVNIRYKCSYILIPLLNDFE